jgi:hypothetical protein
MNTSPRKRHTSVSHKVAAIALFAGTSIAAGQVNILILGADTSGNPEAVRDALLATGVPLNITVALPTNPVPTPTLAELMQYDAVLTWTNLDYVDGIAMGDVLADYIDAGGGVVVGVHALTNTAVNRSLGGRWASGGYHIIPLSSGLAGGTMTQGFVHLPQHLIWDGVTAVTGGTSGSRAATTDLAPHAIRIADWDDGRVLVVASSAMPARVDLNFWPPGWRFTEAARVMANSLVYVATAGSTDPGGCCFPNGTCQVLAGVDCIQQGGSFRGANTDCVDPCPQPGRCCFPSGACDVLLETACNFGGGTWAGAGTDCTPNPCPQPPTGACCLTTGACIIDWEGGCIAQGGLYQGDGSDCGTITCPSRIDSHWNVTTTFTSTNGAGAYFLVEATNPQGIAIQGFDINTNAAAGTPISAHVYFRPVTFVGYTGDQSAWILMGEVQVTAAGANLPTFVPVGGLNIGGSETWALRVGSSAGVRYTSDANTTPIVSDGNVDLHMGEVQSSFFGTSTFGNYPTDLRGFSGSMYYQIGATITTGSCCMPDGSCEEVQEIICTGQGGVYHGDNTTCATTPVGGCPQPPVGACCFDGGACTVVWEPGCLDQGGFYQGDGTDCTITCPFMLTTSYDGTSTASSAGAGAFFNVTAVDSQGIVVEGFQMNANSAAGTPMTVHVYARPNTHVGFESDPSAWIHLGDAQTISAGQGNRTPVPIGGFHIGANETWGFRVGAQNGGIRYNSATTTTPVHNDGRVQIDLGRVQNNFFGTLLLANPAGWNGTLAYSLGATVTAGACCLPNGSCDEVREVICTGQGGTYHGDNTNCATTPVGGCPQPPTGACCLPTGVCQELSTFQCADVDGNYLGDHTTCVGIDCPIIIITNMPGNDGTQSASLGGGRIKAMGFTMPPGDDYLLERIEMRLTLTSTAVEPAVWIYDDNFGQPGTILLTLDTPPVTTTGNITYTVTPPHPFTLDQNTAYWLVVWSSNLTLGWLADSSAIVPTGIAVHSGSLFAASGGPSPPTASQTSAIMNSYALFATPPQPACYANCDNSTTEPVLNVEDFVCFINEFAQGIVLPTSQQITHYANCDHSTTVPVLNVEDFICFINEFSQGCP